MDNRPHDLLAYVFEQTFEEDMLTFTCRICHQVSPFSLAATETEIHTTLWYHLLSGHMLVEPARTRREG